MIKKITIIMAIITFVMLEIMLLLWVNSQSLKRDNEILHLFSEFSKNSVMIDKQTLDVIGRIMDKKEEK